MAQLALIGIMKKENALNMVRIDFSIVIQNNCVSIQHHVERGYYRIPIANATTGVSKSENNSSKINIP